jgi:hypothetical protein
MLESISFPQRSVPPTPPSQKAILSTQNLELSTWEINKIIASTELVVQKWYPWHAKCVRKLGANKYLDLAEMAKSGSDPQPLFAWLLKQELS